MYFHGTTTAWGDLVGAAIDPSRSPGGIVWGTSDLGIAREWAAAAAGEHGGDPVVYEIAVRADAATLALPSASDEDLDAARAEEVGALMIGRGEGGVAEVAILLRHVARFARPTR